MDKNSNSFMDKIKNNKTAVIIGAVCLAVLIAVVVFAVKRSQGGSYDTVGVSGTTESDEQKISAAHVTVDDSVNAYNATGAVTSGTKATADSVINVGGDTAPSDLNVQLYTKLAYELHYLFGFSSFTSASELEVSPLVQFAFCHIYYDSLLDMNSSDAHTYRSCSAAAINSQIKKLFNVTGVNITGSDLYDASAGIFEMWQPSYTGSCYADSTLKNGDGSYTLTSVFYLDAAKTTKGATVTLSLVKGDSGYYISSMTVA